MNWTLDVNTCQFMLGAARRATFNKDQATQVRERLQALGAPVGPDQGDMALEDSLRCKGDAKPVDPWPG